MTVEVPKSNVGTPPPPDGVLELSGNPARDLTRSFNVRVFLFLGLHIPLVFLLEALPVVSTVHALIILAFGVRAALLSKTSHVLYAVAYIAGAEVLWRMTRAYVPWEYAKYATVIIMAIAIVVEWGKQREARRLRSFWPLFLLLALLPAAVITLLQVDLVTARDNLSFNLGAYLSLIMMALYMWARPIDIRTATRLLLALIAPILAVTALAVFNTATFTSDFLLASNWVTSGNYGPNQVSNVMGLAALACIMLTVLIPQARSTRLLLLVLAFVFLGQAMLTFSRGGVYSFVLGLVAFGLHTLRTGRSRGRFLLLVILGTILLVAVIFPWLNSFTGGTLALRLAELDTTGRLEAAQADLSAFSDYIFTGTGVGLATEYRSGIALSSLAAHTEYTRLLGEHGLFGIGAFLILGWMLLKRYVGNTPGMARGFVAGFSIWGLSIMVHSAMRVEVISLALAIALLTWQVDEVQEPVEDSLAVARAPATAPFNPSSKPPAGNTT